MDVHTYLLIF